MPYQPRGIPPKLYRRLQQVLLRCGPFESDAELRALFVEARLQPWRDHVPEAANRQFRVMATISLLADAYNADDVNALDLFLQVVRDWAPEGTACHRDLVTLVRDLRGVAQLRPSGAVDNDGTDQLGQWQPGGHTDGGPYKLVLASGVEMALVKVPQGKFLMGSDPQTDPDAYEDEHPQRKIYLDAYRIGATPVTNAQFAAFVDATGYRTVAEAKGFSVAFNGAGFERIPNAHWRQPQGPGSQATDDHPIVHVSWDDTGAFCRWMSEVTSATVRLPTEAEWEKAARGTEGARYPWGLTSPNAARCNLGRHTLGTTPVGTFSPAGDSPYSCTDMAGNVWEWCADWYAVNAYVHAVARNPTGPAYGAFRVTRGGAWHDETDFARAALRMWHAPAKTHALLGFRCVVAPY
jgi:formylglycine-generating enzyme required for sulfatase activity